MPHQKWFKILTSYKRNLKAIKKLFFEKIFSFSFKSKITKNRIDKIVGRRDQKAAPKKIPIKKGLFLPNNSLSANKRKKFATIWAKYQAEPTVAKYQWIVPKQ
jgi:hypothetical protein